MPKAQHQTAQAPVEDNEDIPSSEQQIDLLKLIDYVPEEMTKIEGVVVGELVGFETSGRPLVDFWPNSTGAPVPARATVALAEGCRGREVALLFEQGNPEQPIVIGLMWHPDAPPAAPAPSEPESIKVSADGKRVLLTAEREIVLRCGASSLTMTREGKIVVKGVSIVSRAKKVNKIKGGAVLLN